jgi:hypothetical protein
MDVYLEYGVYYWSYPKSPLSGKPAFFLALLFLAGKSQGFAASFFVAERQAATKSSPDAKYFRALKKSLTSYIRIKYNPHTQLMSLKNSIVVMFRPITISLHKVLFSRKTPNNNLIICL